MGDRIQQAVGVGGAFLDVFPIPTNAERAPTSSDNLYPRGKIWYDETTIPAIGYIWDGSTWVNFSGGGSGSSVLYLEGDTGGKVPPDGTGTISINSENSQFLTVVGDAGTNSFQITPSNFMSLTANTVGSVISTNMFINLGSTPAVYTFDANISGFDKTTPSGYGCSSFTTVITNGSTAALVQTSDEIVNTSPQMANAGCSIIISGNTVVFAVMGVAGLTVDWRGNIYYTVAT